MSTFFFKYQANGNDFILIDARELSFSWEEEVVKKLCDRHFGIGSDGLILIEKDEKSDFYMRYYNSDGRQASMCANGGRCAAVFSNYLKITTLNEVRFRAIDGPHKAIIKEHTVSLEMKNVSNVSIYPTHVCLDTGSPHHIVFVEDVDKVDVYNEGRKIRYDPIYAQMGVNVNFVQVLQANSLKVSTYERGVENQTLSCGTGVTAAVIAAYELGKINSNEVAVETLGGEFSVAFQKDTKGYKKIWLNGPAEFVFKGYLEIL